MKLEIRKLKLIDLEKPSLSQSRIGTDPETIAKYTALWESGEAESFPEIVVFFDGQKYHIADGFHRAQSLGLARLDRKVEHRTIACAIHIGTLQDAIAYSLGANLKHGLLPSTADKKRSILLYYGLSPEHCAHSDSAISKAVGCSHTFVGSWKTTCVTTPVDKIAAETNIPYHILHETIEHLKSAISTGLIVTVRAGKPLVQAARSSRSARSQTYIVTTTTSEIPRGTIVVGYESLTDGGCIATAHQDRPFVLSISEVLRIPYAIGSKVLPIGEDKELTITGYALVSADLKIQAIDQNGFALIYSSGMVRPLVKKTLEISPVNADRPENNIDAAKEPATPIVDLLSLTDSQLIDLQVAVENELRGRGLS